MVANGSSFPRLKKGLRHFLMSSAGNIAVSASLAAPALMGAMGLASDYAQYTNKKTELQAAADSAALAAAKELTIANASDASIESAARSYADASIASDITTSVDVDYAKSSISVSVKEEWTPFFAHYLGADITPITAKATATLAGRANTCVLALDGADEKSIDLTKNANIKAAGCAIYSNSTHAESIKVKTGSLISADLTCTAGGVDFAGGSIAPAALTDCPVMEDPLASRAEPVVGSCTYTDINISSGSVTLSPGTYCGGLSIGGTAFVTLTSGIYVIKDGKLSVTGGASVIGDYAGFFLVGDKALINFNGNASINLKAPKDGDLAGILFFESRSEAKSRVHKISATNAHTLTGTIYLSRGELHVDPSSKVAENSAYTAIITQALRLSDGPELELNSDYGSTDVPVPDGIRTAAQVVLSD